MKYVLLIALGLLAVGCNLKQEAEEQAWAYVEELGEKDQVEAIVCVNQDSDDDGYVSCTVKKKDGTKEKIECAAEYGPSLNSGCREPKLNLNPFK